jgi:tRNA 2-thiouridine synthesizing protein A
MRTLDCTDLKCPLPLLKLKVAINESSSDRVIRLVTSDSISLRDIPAFCDRAGHRLTSVSEGDPHEFIIEING